MTDTIIESAEVKPQGKTRWSNLLLWVVAVSILGLAGWGLVETTDVRPEAGQPAPDFDMVFFDGYEWQDYETYTLDEFKGKVVVLNFWASWCVECKLEADLLENTWRKYQDQDVVFLGLAYVDAEPKALAYLEEFNITYPNAPDLRSIVSADYEITGVPETFFIDKNGQIAHVQIGAVNQVVLDSTIERLISEGE